MAGTGSKKVVLAALGANAAVAASKLAVGLVTGSVAMLAEAAHSFADTVNQGFLLVSIRLSKNPADEEHPFGYGKERFFWAFLAAVFIFIAGAFFSLYEGIQKLFAGGEHTDGPFWPSYLVLAIAFAFDGGVLLVAIREARHQAREAGLGLRQFLAESSDVTLKTALYEDSAATVGLVTAAIGLVLLQVTGNPIFDGLASIVIGLILVWVAIMLGRETRDLLLGAAAPPRIRQEIDAAIRSFPQVERVTRVLTMQLGLNSLLVTGELRLADNLSTDELEEVLSDITARIREVAPDVKNVYLEPSPPSRIQQRHATTPDPASAP